MRGLRWKLLTAVMGMAGTHSLLAQDVAVRVYGSGLGSAPPAGIRAAEWADYQSYTWARLSAADIATLERQGLRVEVVDGADRLTVNGRAFDPRLGAPVPNAAQALLDAQGRGLYLVQFDAPTRSEWVDALNADGLLPLQYYPHHAVLVWGRPSQLEAVSARGEFRASVPLAAQLRIDPSLVGRSSRIEDASLFLFNPGDADALRARLEATGVVLSAFHSAQRDGRFYRALGAIEAGALEALSRMPEMVWIGRESVPEPDDEMANQVFATNFNPAIPNNQPGYQNFLDTVLGGLSGQGITWAVVDSGVDWDHPDLGAARVGGFDAPGCSALSGGPGDDGGGHGSHVAGSVAGRGRGDLSGPATEVDALGFMYGQGVAPRAGLYSVRSIGCGSMTNPQRVSIPLLAGARGSNNSWNNSNSQPQVQYLASEREYDILVRDGDFSTPALDPFMILFSAGNAGPNPSTLTGPHVAKNIVSVASSTVGRANPASANLMSSFSSRGPAADGRILPTITGVGGSTGSTRRAEGGSCGTAFGGTNNLFSSCSGTSMSTPMVSGAAALVHEWWGRRNNGAAPSPAMTKAILINGARDLPGSGTPNSNDGSRPIPNNDEGWGIVDLRNTLGVNVRGVYRDQEQALNTVGQQVSYTVAAVDPARPLRITLVWTDAPGAVSANPAQVNDLDLEVVNSGNTYRGNVFANGTSTTGGNFDRLHNVENVYISNPGSGNTTITISAAALNGDALAGNGSPVSPRQDFALVCTNCTDSGVRITASSPHVTLCGSTSSGNVTATAQAGYAGSMSFAVNGLPAGWNASFAPTNHTGGGSSTISILPAAGAAGGVYPVSLVADAANGADDRRAIELWYSPEGSVPGAPTLLSPNNESAVPRQSLLRWSAVPGALRYEVCVAESANGPCVESAVVSGTNYRIRTDIVERNRHWTVKALNACGESSTPARASYFTPLIFCGSSTPLLIPDGNLGGVVANPFTIPDPGVVDDLDVVLQATHTRAGDLRFVLRHAPSGVQARLYTQQNTCDGDNINATFDDDLGQPLVCSNTAPAVRGRLLAQDSLSRFRGLSANGPWELTVTDAVTGESGQLDQWCVFVASGGGSELFINGFE